MTLTPKNWQNFLAGGTPIDAAGLVDLESRVGAYVDAVEARVSLRMINVMAAPYNAIGDGVANDTTAIQAAFNAVPARGAIVYFPPGKYLVPNGGLTCDKTVKILGGAGVYNDTVGSNMYMTASSGTLLTLTAPGVHIESMLFSHDRTVTRNADCIGVSMTSNQARVTRNVFTGFSTGLKSDVATSGLISQNGFTDCQRVNIDMQYTGSPDSGDWYITENQFQRTSGVADTGGDVIYTTSFGGLHLKNNKCNAPGGGHQWSKAVHLFGHAGTISTLFPIQGNSFENVDYGLYIDGGGSVYGVSFTMNEVNGLNHPGSTGVYVNGPQVIGLQIHNNQFSLMDVGVDIAGDVKNVPIDGNVFYANITTGVRIRSGPAYVRIGQTNVFDMISGGKSLVMDDAYYTGTPDFTWSVPFTTNAASLLDLFEVGMNQFGQVLVDIEVVGLNQTSNGFVHRVSRVFTSNATGADASAPTVVGTDYASGVLTKTFTVTGLAGPTRFGVAKAAGTVMDGHCKVRVFGSALAYFKPLLRET